MKKTILFTFLLIFWTSFAIAGGNYTQLVLPDFRIPLNPSSGVNPNVDFVGLGDGDFSSGRNSVAYYWDADNVLQSGATNVPRFEFVGGHWAYLGEPEGVNVALWCRDIDDSSAAWTESNTGSAVQTATGIDGVANTATTMTDSDGAQAYSVYQSVAKAGSAVTPYCASVYVDATSGATTFPGFGVLFTGTANKIAFYTINTNAGTVTAYSANDAGNIDASIEDKGSFYRVSVTATDNGANTAIRTYCYPAVNADASDTWVDATQGSAVFDWAQLEVDKKFPSSPIYTEGSEITRASEGGGYPRWALPDAKSGVSSMFEENLGSEEITASDDRDFTTWGNVNWKGTSGASVADGTGKMEVTLDASGFCSTYLGTSYIGNLTPNSLYKVQVDVWQGTTAATAFSVYFDQDNNESFDITIAGGQATFAGYLLADAGFANLMISCATSDGNTVFVDDVSIKEVTNAWDGMPPHGTIVMRWRPGYDQGDTGSTNSGILASSATQASLIYNRDSSGYFVVFDGVNGSTKTYAYSANTWYKLVIQYGYLTSNEAKMRIGYDSGSGITWDTSPSDYDGAFTTGSYLHLLYVLRGPAHIRDIEGWYRILSDGEINNLRD